MSTETMRKACSSRCLILASLSFIIASCWRPTYKSPKMKRRIIPAMANSVLRFLGTASSSETLFIGDRSVPDVKTSCSYRTGRAQGRFLVKHSAVLHLYDTVRNIRYFEVMGRKND